MTSSAFIAATYWRGLRMSTPPERFALPASIEEVAGLVDGDEDGVPALQGPGNGGRLAQLALLIVVQ